MKLAKYHALGNDFLVLVAPGSARDSAGAPDVDARSAVVLCDRFRGVGADGILTIARSGVAGRVTMRLRNADGSSAETSGNGLRCAALAALDAGLVGALEIELETAAGRARARVIGRDSSGGASVAVTMGEVQVGELLHDLLGREARHVDVGNPHLVLYPARGSAPMLSLRAVELAPLEHGIDGEVPDGLNVEAAEPLGGGWGSGAVQLVVWERGAGATLACGSGSVATASALRAAGLAGDRVEVHNPGGVLLVELSGPLEAPEAELTGPAQLVARVEVDIEALTAAAGMPRHGPAVPPGSAGDVIRPGEGDGRGREAARAVGVSSDGIVALP